MGESVMDLDTPSSSLNAGVAEWKPNPSVSEWTPTPAAAEFKPGFVARSNGNNGNATSGATSPIHALGPRRSLNNSRSTSELTLMDQTPALEAFGEASAAQPNPAAPEWKPPTSATTSRSQNASPLPSSPSTDFGDTADSSTNWRSRSVLGKSVTPPPAPVPAQVQPSAPLVPGSVAILRPPPLGSLHLSAASPTKYQSQQHGHGNEHDTSLSYATAAGSTF